MCHPHVHSLIARTRSGIHQSDRYEANTERNTKGLRASGQVVNLIFQGLWPTRECGSEVGLTDAQIMRRSSKTVRSNQDCCRHIALAIIVQQIRRSGLVFSRACIPISFDMIRHQLDCGTCPDVTTLLVCGQGELWSSCLSVWHFTKRRSTSIA